MTKPKDASIDDVLLRQMKQEAEVQVKIADALEPLEPNRRAVVLQAVAHLLEADKLVPGVFDLLLKR